MAFPHDGKKFEKGKSGNPKLEVIIDNVLGDEQNNITAMEGVIIALRNKALKGDVRAAELLLNRAYGNAKSYVDLTSLGEKISGVPDISGLSDETIRELAEKIKSNSEESNGNKS